MTRSAIRCLAAVGFLVFTFTAAAQPRGKVDWIFLVDTSASMRGKGENAKDIFDDVKASLQSFVREASDGDSVAILTFDRDVRSAFRDTLGDRGKAYEAIDRLEANGDRTHLGLAIKEGLERAAMLSGDKTRTQAVVLFTDGKEDVRGIRNPVRIDANVDRVADTYVFFVSMGQHETQLDDFAQATKRTTVLKAPTPGEIREVASRIRTTIESEGSPPPPPPAITITPATFDLGDIEIGTASVQHEIQLTAGRDTRAAIQIDMPAGVTTQPVGEISIPATLPLRFELAQELAPGRRQITIRARNATATVAMNIIEPPLAARIVKALLALLLLLGAAAFFWFRRQEQNRLEGEIEIVRPLVPPEAAYVGLPKLKKSEVVLSSIVPLDALAGTDARLFVKRTRGEKQVCIASTSGSLRVNEIETPVSELYDADVIQLGDAKLRFNRTGHIRPTGEEL